MTVSASAMVVGDLTRRLRRKGNLVTALARAVGIGWGLVMAYVFCIAGREHHLVYTAHRECMTDPREFLHAGELLEKDALRFLVHAHCTNAKYLPDGWIELPYTGTALGVQTSQVHIAGTSYYKITWIGGEAAP